MAADLSVKWFKWFTTAALAHAFLAIVWTTPILNPDLSLVKAVSGGTAGPWGFVGYVLYVIIGFPGMFTWATMYYLVPRVTQNLVYSDRLAFGHFILTNVGLLGSTGLLAIAGYIGGTMLLARNSIEEIDRAISPFGLPIAIFVTIILIGVFLGLYNIQATLRGRRPSAPDA